MPKRTRSRKRTRARRRLKKTAPLAMSPSYFNHKCVGIIPVTGNADTDNAGYRVYSFGRFAFSTPIGSANVIGHDNTLRFQQVLKNYEQYAIKGFAFKFIPTSTLGIVSGDQQPQTGAIRTLWTYDDVDTFDAVNYTAGLVVALDTFKTYSSTRVVKLYRNNKPLAKQMKTAWIDTNQPFDLLIPDVPMASFNFRIEWAGFNGATPPVIGYIKYTYYITFRG